MSRARKSLACMRVSLNHVVTVLAVLRHGFHVVDVFVAVVLTHMLLWNKETKDSFSSKLSSMKIQKVYQNGRPRPYLCEPVN